MAILPANTRSRGMNTLLLFQRTICELMEMIEAVGLLSSQMDLGRDQPAIFWIFGQVTGEIMHFNRRMKHRSFGSKSLLLLLTFGFLRFSFVISFIFGAYRFHNNQILEGRQPRNFLP